MLQFSLPFLSLLLLSIKLGTVFAKQRTGPQAPSIMDSFDNNIIEKENDNRYTVNLNVSGTTVNVILDTGSTDMWVAPPGGIGPFQSTGVVARLNYGDGSDFVIGTVGLGVVSIAGFTIPAQAFVNVTQDEDGVFECLDFGVCGLVGVGFDSLANIPIALTDGGQNGATVGKSVLTSIFDQNPDKERFFALALSRLDDQNDSADASLTIGEFDERYSSVQGSPILPQFPQNGSRWSILSDGISVNGVSIPWTSNIQTAPAGTNPILLDTGTSNILVPAEVRDAIYSSVPGAVLAVNSSIPNPHFSEDSDVWVVPCSTVINMTTQFGGQDFPIHPLDLTDLVVEVGPDGQNHTICIGTITNGGSITSGGDGVDALYGDTFLRNVYSVYGFANATIPNYIQLLSVTPDSAAADFASVRAKLLAASPPELSPSDTIQLFDGSSSASQISDNLATSAAPSTDSDSQIAKYAPIVIGLLGANLLILLVLAFFGIMSFVRRGGRSGSPSKEYVPVKFREERVSIDRPYSDGPH